MGKTTDAAASAAGASLSDADLERVREFTREPVLLEGEELDALAPGTARRRAADAALVEIDTGAEAPSIEWRREYSLMLGLERLLSEDTPELLDGAELSEHQVDALSGTLAALVAELELNGESRGNGSGNGELDLTDAKPPAAAADAGSDPAEAEDLSANGDEGDDASSDDEEDLDDEDELDDEDLEELEDFDEEEELR